MAKLAATTEERKSIQTTVSGKSLLINVHFRRTVRVSVEFKWVVSVVSGALDLAN